jgi:hypothetical protein
MDGAKSICRVYKQEVLGINILHTGVMGVRSGGLTKILEVKIFLLRFQFCNLGLLFFVSLHFQLGALRPRLWPKG